MAKPNTKTQPRLRKSQTTSEERYLKVRETHYEYHTKEQHRNSGCRPVPILQMKGHWLKKAGFDINTPIKVRVMEGCLVLTAEPETA